MVLRRMQRSLAAARNRKMAQRLDAARAPNAGRFPWWAVPWWAYALIALHLVYRVIKVRLRVCATWDAAAGCECCGDREFTSRLPVYQD